MFKQSSETAKIIFPKLSNIKRITTPKHNFNRFNFDINNNNNNNKYLNKNTLCKKHQEPFIEFCQNCNIDLCQICIYTHDNDHPLIKYSDIIPDENEINYLIQTLKNFQDNYYRLLDEIKKWKNNLEEQIFFLEKEIDKNEILNNIYFVNDFSNVEINFNNIFKFRKIFFEVLGGGTGVESRKNNDIINKINIYSNIENDENNMGYFNHTQYNISKALLDLLLNNNINKNNNIDNSFIYKGNLIIKYLWDSFINMNKTNINYLNNNKKIIKTNLKKKYDTNTYSGSFKYDKDVDVFFNDNVNRNISNNSKIIEKHIDLKKGSKKKLRKNLYSNNTCDVTRGSSMYNDKYNFNRTMTSSFSSKNLINQNFGSNNKEGIYLKKKCNLSSSNIINNNFNNKLNQTEFNIASKFNIGNSEENNKVNDFGINQGLLENHNSYKKNIENIGINNFKRANSLKIINKNTFNPQKIKEKNFNINSEQNKEIITSKYIPEIKTKNLIHNDNIINLNMNNINNINQNNIFNTEKKNSRKINSINNNSNNGKIFTHKKFEAAIENNSPKINIKNEKVNEEENKINQTQLYNKLNETSFQEDSINNSNMLNTTFNQRYSTGYYNINKNVIISKKKFETNSNLQFISNSTTNNILENQIKSTIFKQQIEQINNNNINQALLFNNGPTKIQIRKNNPDTKYIIKPNLPLYISLELDNDNCKLCFVNQINQEIELFCFAQEQYTIPMIISFNQKNEIIIGHEAEQMSTMNPERTIFNLIKMFGKKYNEINGMKEIWPFKIYQDEKNRPFFEINLGKKNKKFYPEDLLSLYLKKLFKIFFKKIICEENLEDNITNINIILVLCVPNNFTYFQRKGIEKIFEKHIFPSEQNKDNTIPNNNDNNSIYGTKYYNNYQINLKKIKIENSSSIAALCLKPSNNKNKNNTKHSNSLIINIGGSHTNISIACYPSNKNKSDKNLNFSKTKYFGIKSLSGIELGFQDFTDNFVYDCLKEFDKNLYKQCLEMPNALAKLRKSCTTAQKIFEENSHVEIKVNKLYQDYDLKMILNKSDYEKVCDNLYKKINLEIKKTIKEAKMSEININNILLIGSISRSDKIKNLLKNMFKHNRLLFNEINNSPVISDINNDFYCVIGGAIQAKNYIMGDSYLDNCGDNIFSLHDISPMSFGVETINGMMEFIIEKGTNIPVEKCKYIKIRNDRDKYLEIKIYEGENNKACNNRLISSANIDKRNFKSEKVGDNYIEILIQFELNLDLNLCVYVLDIKTMKRRFECLINVDIVKN